MPGWTHLIQPKMEVKVTEMMGYSTSCPYRKCAIVGNWLICTSRWIRKLWRRGKRQRSLWTSQRPWKTSKSIYSKSNLRRLTQVWRSKVRRLARKQSLPHYGNFLNGWRNTSHILAQEWWGRRRDMPIKVQAPSTNWHQLKGGSWALSKEVHACPI